MPEGNPLVVDAKQDPDGPGAFTAGNGDYGWAGGIGLAESSMDAFNGIKDGDWVSGGLGVLSLAGEIAGAAIDPFGYLMSSVASFLMEHIQPLKDMLDSVAGNPPVIQSYADTWGNVSKTLGERKTDFDNAVKNGTAGWTGQGADAYRKFAAEHSDALSGAATVAGAISTVTMIMGQVVSFVRETVRQLIADLVGKLIAWVMEEVFSLGFGTPVVVAQASAAIAKWGKKIGELLKKLTDTIRRVSPLLSKLVDIFEKIAKVFGKVLGKVSGLDGLKVKEGGFVHKVPKGEGGGVHARGHGGDGEGSSGGDGESSHSGDGDSSPDGETSSTDSGDPGHADGDSPSSDPMNTDSSADPASRRSSSGDGSRSPDGSPSHAGDDSPSASGDGSPDGSPSSVRSDGSPSHAGDSSPSHAGDSTPSHAGDGSPSSTRSPSHASDSSPSPTRAGDSSPSHAGDSSPSPTRGADSTPCHAGDSSPSPTRGADSTPSHAGDGSPSPTRAGDNAPSHAGDSSPSPTRGSDSTPSHAGDSNPSPTRAGDSSPAPTHSGSPSHADGGSPAHSGSSPAARSDAPGSHAGTDTPSSAAPPRADGTTSASGTAPTAPRTGDPGTVPTPRGGDGAASGAPAQGGAPMMGGGGMPPGGAPGGGGLGGGSPRTGGGPGWTGTPGSPGAHIPHVDAPGRPRTGGDLPEGRPRPGGDTPRPRTPDAPAPAARGYGPGTHGPDTRPGGTAPGTRPGGPGHTGPGGTHGPDGHGPHENAPHENGPHDPDGGAPHHGDSEPLTPDEVNARHSESTPSGSSYHAGDPDMGDLPHRVQPDPDGRYTVDVHVTPDGHARIGDRLYTPEEFADVLRRNADYDGRPVRLIGCDASSNDFAHRLSRELDTEVMAPTKPAWTDSHGRVFSSDYEIGPDGRMRPRIPPDGEWNTHHPDGSTHAAGDDGFAPDTRHHDPHDVDADSARHRGDDDNPRQRDAAGADADPDNPRQRQAPPPGTDPDVPADRNPLSRQQEHDLTDPHRQAEVRANPQHGAEFDPPGGEHVPVGPGSTHPDAPRAPHAGERFPSDQRLEPHRSYQVVDADGTPRGTYHTDGSGRVTHIETSHPNVPPRLADGTPNPAYHPNPDVTHPHPNTTYKVDIDGQHQTFHTDADGVPHPSVQFHRPDFEGDPVRIGPGDPHSPGARQSFAQGGPYEPHTRYEVVDQKGVPRGTFYTDADGHVRWAEVESGRIARSNPDLRGIDNPRLVPPDAEVHFRQRVDPNAEVPEGVANPERFRGAQQHDVHDLPNNRSFLDSQPKNPDGSPKLEPNSKYVVHGEYKVGEAKIDQPRSVYWTDEHGRVAVAETFRPHSPDMNNPGPNMVYDVDNGRFTYQTGADVNGRPDTVHGNSDVPKTADEYELQRRDGTAQGVSGQQGPGGVYDGGHIAGNQFRGPGELLNMMSQWRPQNQGWPGQAGPDHWYAFETDLANHLKAGGKIDSIDVFPLRNAGDHVPHTIQVRWVEVGPDGGPIVHMRSFPNTPAAPGAS
ncbi:DNA/RNA non-specific endonuclease [Amycolatopsis sp. RTGN1]|uniref:DNA/RNA non-specific endonuclease n=1 Tax=Amycolatopsis ponsaeliensis TaxID=2992142 RepID=UPI00254DA7E5|nr:DNA/RNA non-specific endonuclease [Amycolatopsis sp. RTGN1]